MPPESTPPAAMTYSSSSEGSSSNSNNNNNNREDYLNLSSCLSKRRDEGGGGSEGDHQSKNNYLNNAQFGRQVRKILHIAKKSVPLMISLRKKIMAEDSASMSPTYIFKSGMRSFRLILREFMYMCFTNGFFSARDVQDPSSLLTCDECKYTTESEVRFRLHFSEPRHVNHFRYATNY